MRPVLPITLVCLALLAGCGSDADTAATTATDATDTTVAQPDSGASTTVAAPGSDLVKPEVQIPAELPTELVITDLTEGTGEPAGVGDTVEVHYVGVRSADGQEFDNSYDRGTPFPVVLGQGGVIPGWEQGLIGIKEGGRRQLDIPAELAYGDNPPPDDVIQPGDALTFVIDAVSVVQGVDVPVADPADKPVVDVQPSTGANELSTTDLVVGDGATAATGQTAYVQITAYRGDTAEELQSTWDEGTPAQIPLDESTITGLVDSIVGMNVGGRRLVVLPPDDAFGPDGNTSMGLPANTDLILVIDLVLLNG